MYAATLFEEVDKNLADLYGFGDDHILNNSFEASSRVQEINAVLDLEDAAVDVKHWMDGVKLKMNSDKTEYIQFGSRQQLEKCVTETININGDIINKVDCIRYLGVFLDKNLTMKHVERKAGVAMSNFNKIRKIRRFLSKEACETLMLGLVISHIDYANGTLFGAPDTTLKPYQRIQNMCIRLLNNRLFVRDVSVTELLMEAHWLPVRARIEFKASVIAFNCFHNTAPEYLNDLLCKQTVKKGG